MGFEIISVLGTKNRGGNFPLGVMYFAGLEDSIKRVWLEHLTPSFIKTEKYMSTAKETRGHRNGTARWAPHTSTRREKPGSAQVSWSYWQNLASTLLTTAQGTPAECADE